MRRMSRHTERNYILVLAVQLEFDRVVALVAVEDEEPVSALPPALYIEIEVFYLFEALLVRRPAVFSKVDNLVRR